jgi:hypothetical protein
MKNLIPYNLFEMARYSVDDILESIKKVYRSVSRIESVRDVDSLKNEFLEKFEGKRFTNLIKATYIPINSRLERDISINNFSSRAHENVIKGIVANDVVNRDGNTMEYRRLKKDIIEWGLTIFDLTDNSGYSSIKCVIDFDIDGFYLVIRDVESEERGVDYKYSYGNDYTEEELWKSIFKKIKGYERIDK